MRGHGRRGVRHLHPCSRSRWPCSETPRSKRWNVGSIVELFKQCFPLFIALFLYAFIDNMPKFVMEGVLSYDNQLYFNALYFPAQGILLTVGSSTSRCS